jgi:MFS family permease
MNAASKSVLRVVFVTLFLDLVGFSIIFPLFPSMLEHYLLHEGHSGLFGKMLRGIELFSESAGAGPGGTVVLFGGLLGSLYSLLQFLFAPVMGSLSDRYGRRPVLLVSVAGLALSYLLWFFSETFLMLVAARLIGGIMSGNISTATAVVADVTTDEERPKGMALIGIAFGIGFILGPALGGISALLDLTKHWPGLVVYGVNPFSVPALVAFLLSVGNLIFVATNFRETLPKDSVARNRPMRTVNPLKLFHGETYPGVTRTNFAYFLFLSAFSGTEFALTFLAADRFGYGPLGNALMLLFVGVVLAGMQGTYVQRKSAVIGAKRMSVHGLFMAIPGLVLVGFAPHPLVLYVGLFFMAAGSAQVIPCMTALASLYTPADAQGRVLGVFRSLGALARALGPLIACMVYWRLGPAVTYYVVAVFLAVPLIIAQSLPQPGGTLAQDR